MIYKDGVTRKAACSWLNTQIEVLNANLGPDVQPFTTFNLSNFTTHLSKHISSMDDVKVELLASSMMENPTANAGFTEGEQLLAEAMQDSLKEGTEFKDFPAILENFEGQIIAELTKDTSLTDAGRNFRTQTAVDKIKLFQALMTVKQNMADIQRTAAVGGNAVKTAVRKLGVDVMRTNKKIAEEVRAMLRTHFPEGSFPDEICDMIIDRTSSHLRTQVDETIQSVGKLYGIKLSV